MRLPIEESYITFRCPNRECSEIIKDTDFSIPGYDLAGESHADAAGYECETVICQACEEEYEVSVFNTMGNFQASVNGHTDTHVHVHSPDEMEFDDRDEYEDYLASFEPEDPFASYEHSSAQIDILVKSLDPAPFNKTFNRMVFLQYIGIMEAYLGDRILTLALALPEVQVNIATKHPALRKKQFEFQAFVGKPTIVADTIAATLKHQLYHKMREVDALYTHALGESIFVDDEQRAFLTAATIKRHDCVHRNGKTKDGVSHDDIDQTYITAVARSIDKLVANIETKFVDLIERSKPPLPF